MHSVGLINIRSLNAQKATLEQLALHMREHSLQALGLIETKTNHHDDSLTSIHNLGYTVFVPPVPHPPCGGLAIIHSVYWKVRSHTYISAPSDNSERLIIILEHTTTPNTILPLALLYIPPSSSLQQFQAFLTALFTDIAELQSTQGLTPVILTDANAHCVTGLDDLRSHGIPNRSMPYNRNKRSKSLTPQGKRGTILEQLSKLNEYVILNNRAKGDNNSPTFTAHHRQSVIDYILVPRQHYVDVVAFDILGGTNTQFNTDHNMLHLICDSQDSQPRMQNPNGLDKDAILFPKFALIDLDTRAKYQAAIEKHLKPFVVGGGYRAIVQQGRQLGHSNQQIADIINATILAMIRAAAEEALGSMKPTSFTSAPLPLWWDPESSHLTAKLRTYTALLRSLTKKAASRSRPVMRILARISTTRKQLRSSTAKAKAKHDKSYHRHVSRQIPSHTKALKQTVVEAGPSPSQHQANPHIPSAEHETTRWQPIQHTERLSERVGLSLVKCVQA